VPALDSGDELALPGWVLEVDQPTLQRAMRYAFEHQAEVRATGERAAAAVRDGFTWAHSARKAVARLAELSTRAPISRAGEYEPLNAYEKRYYSQHGEDGVALELFARLRTPKPFFVEIGPGTGEECNTRLLSQTYDWNGVMIEAAAEPFAALRRGYTGYPHVRPVHARATRENIAGLFAQHGVPADLDFLAIDVHGNDYYLWEALAAYRPRVVLVAINAAHAPPRRWVVAYDPDFTGQDDDYFGASLASLTSLGDRLGYALLGIDDSRSNAFFVRRELLDTVGFPERKAGDIYRPPANPLPHRDGPSVDL